MGKHTTIVDALKFYISNKLLEFGTTATVRDRKFREHGARLTSCKNFGDRWNVSAKFTTSWVSDVTYFWRGDRAKREY